MEKMKHILFKTCLTGIVLSVGGLANAAVAGEPVTIFTPQLTSHAVISGGALNIAADSVVDGNLAAQAAVTIGAGLNTQTQDIYAGAAVTTGALSTVKHIFSGAAAGIGASATAQNVHAGAAITVGAGGDVQKVYAGAAITLGAGAYYDDTEPLGANANTDSAAPKDIHNATSMAEAIAQIGVAQAALSSLNNSTTNPPEFLYTTMGGFVSLAPGVHQGSAVSIAANSKVEFTAPVDNTDDNYVWVINLTEALTVGAGTEFTTANLTGGDTATIIWNVGAAVTLGAGTEFIGTAFVGGAFGAATSTVSCGNIYATGAVSIGSISAAGGCPTNASSAVDIIIYATGAMTLRPRDAICTTTPSGLHTLITSGAAAHYVSDSSYDDSGSILFVNFSVTLASGHEERWAVHVDTHDFVHTALRYPLHINYVKLSPPPHVTIQVDTDSAWGVGRPAARACLAALWGAVTD